MTDQEWFNKMWSDTSEEDRRVIFGALYRVYFKEINELKERENKETAFKYIIKTADQYGGRWYFALIAALTNELL